MRVLRSLGFGLIALLFGLSVSILIMMGALHQTILQRQVVKRWLADSQLYDQHFRTLLSANTSQAQGNTAIGNVITPELITSTLQETFNPTYLQKQTEYVVDSTYDWLEGKQPAIMFSVNTPQLKNEFEAKLRPTIAARYEQLPICPPRTVPNLLDALEGRCMPRGVTVEMATDQTVKEVSSNIELFNRPLTNAAFTAPPDSSLNQQFASTALLPMYVAAMKWLLIAAVPVAMLCAVGMIFLARSKRAGVRAIGWRLAVGSLLVVVIGWFAWAYGNQLNLQQLPQMNTQGQNPAAVGMIEGLLHQAVPDIGFWIFALSGVGAVLGLLILLSLAFWRPKPQGVNFLAPESSHDKNEPHWLDADAKLTDTKPPKKL